MTRSIQALTADHSLDALDVEATVAAIRERTGQRPSLIGHKDGSLVSLARLRSVERDCLAARG